MSNDNNKKPVGFVLYGKDIQAFEERVKSSGLDNSEFCRQAVLGDGVVFINNLKRVPELIHLLYSASGSENTDIAITELEKNAAEYTCRAGQA